MNEYIERLKAIKKDELDERSFYEQVLTIINDMENIELTTELAAELKTTLQEIGCMHYEDWKIEKERAGIRVKERSIEKRILKGDISAAVSIIDQFLFDPEKSRFIFSYLKERQMPERWLWNSKEERLKESQNRQRMRNMKKNT